MVGANTPLNLIHLFEKIHIKWKTLSNFHRCLLHGKLLLEIFDLTLCLNVHQVEFNCSVFEAYIFKIIGNY